MNEFISEKSLDFSDLINQISEETTLSNANVACILNALINVTYRTLSKGETVSIPGLGRFIVIQTPSRHTYHPGTQEKIILPGERNVSFKYYKELDHFLKGLNSKAPKPNTMLHTKVTTNMKTIFEHIATDTLTNEVLMDLIAQGCDINMLSRSGNTPLIYAYKKRKNNSIKLLLDNDADQTVYEDGYYVGEFIDSDRTILDLAREDNNIAILLMLVKNKARCNALEMQNLQKNPEQYDEKSKQWIEEEADALDNNKEADIRATIKTIITKDSILQKYPQFLALVESITHCDYTFDFTGGNADDKIEAATIELKIKGQKNKDETITHHIEYFLLSNWSYAVVQRMLLWRTGKKTRRILDIKNRELTTLTDHEKAIHILANSLLGKKNYMPLEHFVRFLVVLLSRIVQKNQRTIEVHTEELGLQQHSL